jgi:hypothetical protein
VESTTQPSPFLYYFSVSKLAHFDFCSKRSKLEIFNQVGEPKFGTGSIARGNRLHYLYNYPNKGFDRLRLRLMLRNLAILHKTRLVFKKQVDNRLSFNEWLRENYLEEYKVYAK